MSAPDDPVPAEAGLVPAQPPPEVAAMRSDEVTLTSTRSQSAPHTAAAQATITASSFTSPLLPPVILMQYAQVPGALEHILKVLDRQQEHSHAMDREQMAIAKQESQGSIDDARSSRRQARFGQMASVLVCLGTLVAGTLVCLYGLSVYAPVAGLLLALGGPATIVTLLVTGKSSTTAAKAALKEAEATYTQAALVGREPQEDP